MRGEHKTARRGRKHAWPTIRRRGDSWVVDCGTVFGKRERRQFDEVEEAEKHAQAQRDRRATLRAVQRFEDTNRSVQLTGLTDSQRIDMLRALEVLAGRGTLTNAAEFWVKHSAPAAGARNIREVFEEYVAGKIKAGRRPVTIVDVRSRLGLFVLEHAKADLHAITTTDIERWIGSRKGTSPENRDGYRRAFVAFFNYAVKRRYCESNPAACLEVPRKDLGYKQISILTPDEAGRLLAAALERAPEMLPYFAIGLFAGLRPNNELAGLDWRNIDFTHSIIHVQAASAKTRRERFVELSPNLAAWLLPHRRDSGRIPFTKALFDRVREKAGLIPPREVKETHDLRRTDGRSRGQKKLGARKGQSIWRPDIMRHSFASYHLVAHNDAGRTAAQLGHGAHLDMLFQHYRRAVRPELAAAFWAIRPPEGNVIQFAASG